MNTKYRNTSSEGGSFLCLACHGGCDARPYPPSVTPLHAASCLAPQIEVNIWRFVSMWFWRNKS